MWITEHTMVIPTKNARSPRTRLRRNLERSMTQRVDVPAAMTKLKARTDKYNAEVVRQSQERSQNGDQRVQAHMTKVTSTTTALVEDEPDEEDVENAREVIAGAQEQLDITSSLLKQR